jgi:hypothetical protein
MQQRARDKARDTDIMGVVQDEGLMPSPCDGKKIGFRVYILGFTKRVGLHCVREGCWLEAFQWLSRRH